MNKVFHHPTFYENIETIYDLHAANMYGCIYKIVQSQKYAEEILTSIFEDISKNYSFDNKEYKQSIWYIKLALKKTFAFLKSQNLTTENFSSINERIVALQKNITSPVSAHA